VGVDYSPGSIAGEIGRPGVYFPARGIRTPRNALVRLDRSSNIRITEADRKVTEVESSGYPVIKRGLTD